MSDRVAVFLISQAFKHFEERAIDFIAVASKDLGALGVSPFVVPRPAAQDALGHEQAPE